MLSQRERSVSGKEASACCRSGSAGFPARRLPHAVAAGAPGFRQGGFSAEIRHPVPGKDAFPPISISGF